MAANNILTFAQGGGALVLTQAAYAADAQRPVGHQPGVARPDFANKVLRQSSLVAAALAQLVADNQATDVTDDLTPAALAAMILAALRSAMAIPAGVTVWVPGTSPLPGTVEQNGAVLTRSAYPRLWTFAQGSGNLAASDAAWAANNFGKFSPGDGATTFRIPDARGYGVRAWDHGRGIDSGRDIGSGQADQFGSHGHGVNDPQHGHGVNDPSHGHVFTVSYVNESGSGTPWGSGGGAFEGNFTQPVDNAVTGISIQAALSGISIQSAGGGETRGKNIAWMPLMFY